MDFVVAFLGLSSIVAIFIFIVKLIIDIVRKKPKKTGLIGLGVSVIIFIILVSIPIESDVEDQNEVNVTEDIENKEDFILSDKQKNILKKDYENLSSSEITEIETIERDLSKYNKEDQEIITEDLKRINEEKIAFDEKEKETKKETARQEEEEETARQEEEEETARQEQEEETARQEQEEETARQEQEEETARKEQEEEVKKETKNTSETSSGTTLSQENAIGAAKEYLNYTSFSKSGLIQQLEYEGFSNEEATYAVDQITVDWKAQAVGAGENYLDYTSFSRSGLIEQLEYEGFSNEEATYAVDQIGL